MAPEIGIHGTRTADAETVVDTADRLVDLRDVIKLGVFALGTAAALALVHYTEKRSESQMLE